MLRAITKAESVVAEPIITSTATSAWSRYPSATASGSARAASTTSFIAVARTAGPRTAKAFLASNSTPIAMKPTGVAASAIEPTVLPTMVGMGMRRSAHRRPATMPMMMGLVSTPRTVLPSEVEEPVAWPGRMATRMTTAITL